MKMKPRREGLDAKNAPRADRRAADTAAASTPPPRRRPRCRTRGCCPCSLRPARESSPGPRGYRVTNLIEPVSPSPRPRRPSAVSTRGSRVIRSEVIQTRAKAPARNRTGDLGVTNRWPDPLNWSRLRNGPTKAARRLPCANPSPFPNPRSTATAKGARRGTEASGVRIRAGAKEEPTARTVAATTTAPGRFEGTRWRRRLRFWTGRTCGDIA
mmetsp:Transcript_8508/g.23740  ORF Transcript_8508/g.23740 Transcript_8508/m.23740 type:complete len:213 (+) Transcript_8508:1783-2421(+)